MGDPARALMPHRRTPDGSFVRLAYRPEDYTVPARELENLAEACLYGTVYELAQHDGMFANYARVADFTRDGAPWVRLRERGRGWLIEVELTERPPNRILPVPPEEAWAHGRALDAQNDPPIPVEGAPTLGSAGPTADRGPQTANAPGAGRP